MSNTIAGGALSGFHIEYQSMEKHFFQFYYKTLGMSGNDLVQIKN